VPVSDFKQKYFNLETPLRRKRGQVESAGKEVSTVQQTPDETSPSRQEEGRGLCDWTGGELHKPVNKLRKYGEKRGGGRGILFSKREDRIYFPNSIHTKRCKAGRAPNNEIYPIWRGKSEALPKGTNLLRSEGKKENNQRLCRWGETLQNHIDGG